MLSLDLHTQARSEMVQSHWRLGRLPHFSGITLGDGRLIVMSEASHLAGGQMACRVSPVCESCVSSFVEFSGEFVEVTSTTPLLHLNEGLSAIAGEGEMGNEGFVALVSGTVLVWSAFFTSANPFYQLNLGQAGKLLVATSTHELHWHFPMASPWDVTVSSSVDPGRA